MLESQCDGQEVENGVLRARCEQHQTADGKPQAAQQERAQELQDPQSEQHQAAPSKRRAGPLVKDSGGQDQAKRDGLEAVKAVRVAQCRPPTASCRRQRERAQVQQYVQTELSVDEEKTCAARTAPEAAAVPEPRREQRPEREQERKLQPPPRRRPQQRPQQQQEQQPEVHVVHVEPRVLAEASAVGLGDLLKNLAARPEAIASGKSSEEVLVALRASRGLVNVAKRLLIPGGSGARGEAARAATRAESSHAGTLAPDASVNRRQKESGAMGCLELAERVDERQAGPA